jgi:hypothetical protein
LHYQVCKEVEIKGMNERPLPGATEKTDMSCIALKITRFKVRALKCIGANAGATPHHLTTKPGPLMGQLGSVMTPMGQMPVVEATPRVKPEPVSAEIIPLFPEK